MARSFAHRSPRRRRHRGAAAASPRARRRAAFSGAARGFHTNDADLLLDGAIAGLGLVYSFDFHVEEALARGALDAAPLCDPSLVYPVHALYPKSRHLMPRARVFVDFLVELFEARRKQAKKTRRDP